MKTIKAPHVIALVLFAVQIAFHGNYGYFRDELYYIACSHHLAFGYVDQPPLSIAILWINRMLLGDSLQALRLLSSVACAGAVLLAGSMARRLGGGTFAQGLAALAVATAPGLIGQGELFSMNSFDLFFWAAACALVVRFLTDDEPKLWIAFGVVAGCGLLNKYSIGFLCIGLAAGLLLTPRRRQLTRPWFWLGALVAALMFLPHVIWEWAHGFPSVEFMRNASTLKNVNLGVPDFLMGQLRDMNLPSAPLWLSGIWFFASARDGALRPLAWMYPVVFFIMIASNAKIYYLAPIYPLYFAGGAVFAEHWITEHGWSWMKRLYPALLILTALVALPFALPVLPVDRFIAYEQLLGLMPRAQERSAVAELPQYYADQFGWEKMVSDVAGVYAKLTPKEQAQCVIYVRNYGEAAAIEFFGKKYGLPGALCAHNNYWLWGPGGRTGDVAIIFGGGSGYQENLADLRKFYSHVELAWTTGSKYAMPFENGRMIFICRGMNTTFQKIWPGERFYM